MKMETLNGEILPNFQLQNSLVRIVDIVNFDGPLLALFQNINNRHLYLLDWVDKDAIFNRWLAYRCNPMVLDKFIREQISHFDLFMSDESFCYKIDIDKNLNWYYPQKIEKINLPSSYIPISDTFFENCDCPNFTKLEHFITHAKESKKQENLVIIPDNYISQPKRFENKNINKLKEYNRTEIISNQIKRIQISQEVSKYSNINSSKLAISNKLKAYK